VLTIGKPPSYIYRGVTLDRTPRAVLKSIPASTAAHVWVSDFVEIIRVLATCTVASSAANYHQYVFKLLACAEADIPA
jgi:hypothetical protein